LEEQESPFIEKFLFRIAKQWIAGDTMEEALKSATQANKNGMGAILNRLGEHSTSKSQIDRTVSEYLILVSNLHEFKIPGGISVKPTQIGLTLSVEECRNNFETITEKAALSESFVWIDMESSEYTDDTIKVYLSLFEKYERLGLAIQANLKRTENDLEVLLSRGAKIRLVKGAYRENKKIAYKTRHEVDENYKKLMRVLFTKGNEFGIATHDSKLIELAMNLSLIHI